MEDNESFSCDNLLKTVKDLLDFLETINQYPHLGNGPLLKNAIRRYEQFWLPLLADHTSLTTPLTAPLDIAWVWYTHVLSTSYYVKDCIKLFNKVLDHKLRNSTLGGCGDDGYRKAKLIWDVLYSNEPFNVDLARPLKHLKPHETRLKYNLETACQRQFKFYYSVALPHYRDDKFLNEAFERYQEHLQLLKEHQNMISIPCRDVDLIWRAHRISPLAYRQDILAFIGRMPSHEATESHSIPLSRVRDSEEATRRVWLRAGKRFERPGTAHRGEQPNPAPPRPVALNPSFSVFDYEAELLQFEVYLREPEKNYQIRLAHAQTHKPFYKLKVSSGVTNILEDRVLAEFKLQTGTVEKILVQVYQTKLFRKVKVATQELDLQPYMRTLPAIQMCHEIDINEDFLVKLSIYIRPPRLVQYSFTVPQASNSCSFDVTPTNQAVSGQTMTLPLTAVAQPMAHCTVSNQAVMDPYGREVFTCRVIHSSAIPLSAIELIDKNAEVVATARVLEEDVLPNKDDVTQATAYVTADYCEGERAVIIRGSEDWAICVGKWITVCRDEKKNKYSQYLGLKVYKLQNPRGWCAVRKFKEGVYLIQIAPDDKRACIYVNLTSGEIVLAPVVEDIPEAVALGFSVAMLHLLCQPYEPTITKEAAPSSFRTRLAHPYTVANESLALVVAVGYFCDTVPTNEYMKRTNQCYAPVSIDMLHACAGRKVIWRDIGYQHNGRYFRQEPAVDGGETRGKDVDRHESEDLTTEDGDGWGDVGLVQGRSLRKAKSGIEEKPEVKNE